MTNDVCAMFTSPQVVVETALPTVRARRRFWSLAPVSRRSLVSSTWPWACTPAPTRPSTRSDSPLATRSPTTTSRIGSSTL